MKIIRGFQVQASFNVGAGATQDLLANSAPLNQVPANQKLIITAIATYVGADIAAWGKLTWNLLANGGPIDPDAIYLYNQQDQLGQNNMPLILGVPLIVGPSSLLTVPVFNSDIIPHSAGVLIIGSYAVD